MGLSEAIIKEKGNNPHNIKRHKITFHATLYRPDSASK